MHDENRTAERKSGSMSSERRASPVTSSIRWATTSRRKPRGSSYTKRKRRGKGYRKVKYTQTGIKHVQLQQSPKNRPHRESARQTHSVTHQWLAGCGDLCAVLDVVPVPTPTHTYRPIFVMNSLSFTTPTCLTAHTVTTIRKVTTQRTASQRGHNIIEYIYNICDRLTWAGR